MDSQIPADFDPRQVSLFLDKIGQDCDTELLEITAKRDAEIAHIRGEAHIESRRLFRHSAELLRTRLALERSRYLARVRSDRRRQRWAILVEFQQRVLDAVSERFREAWQDPDRQWKWCRYWLVMARERAGDSEIRIILGDGGLEDVRAKVEKELIDHPAGVSVIIDTRADPGICIEWGEYLMDGRLASQNRAITDAVLNRLTDLLSEHNAESS